MEAFVLVLTAVFFLTLVGLVGLGADRDARVPSERR
jgi:hypothetical protein